MLTEADVLFGFHSVEQFSGLN